MYYDVILLGVVTSILFAEWTGLSPAGLVVPGYIVLALKTPGRLAYTFLVVLLTWGIVRFLGRYMILYGRRSFAAMILVSYLVDLLLTGSGFLPYAPDMIGCLVAGIIAREFDRQGFGRTVLSLGIVVAVLALVLMLLGHPVLEVRGG